MRAIRYKVQQLRQIRGSAGRFQRWLRTSKKGKIVLSIVLIQLLLWIAGPAVADGLVDSRSPAAFLPGFNLADSHGVKMGWFLDLDIDEGGVSNWSGFLAFTITNLLWVCYLYIISLLLYLAKTIFDMEWLNWLAPPIENIADALEKVIASIGWVGLFGVIAAIIAGFMAMKGASVRAIGQIVIAMIVASLATGVLANPVSLLTGDDGALMKAQEYGSEAAVMLVDPEAATGDSDLNVDQAIVAPLIDIFVRQPHQVLSFGQIVDGTDCEETYTEAVQGDDDKMGIKDAADPRGAMGDCHKPLKEWADNTSVLSSGLAVMVLLGNSVLNLFLGGLLALMVWSALMALWEAIKFMISAPVGTISGGARGLAWRNISHAGFECLYVVLFLVFIAVYINLIRDFLESVPTNVYVIRQIMVNTLLIMGLIIAFIMRRKLKKQGDRMGDALNQMTGGGAAPAPVQASPFKAMAAVEAAKGVAHVVSKFKGAGKSAPAPNMAPRPVAAPPTRAPVAPRSGPSAPPSAPPSTPPAPAPSGSGGPNTPAVAPNAGAAEKQMVPSPQPVELSSRPDSGTADTKKKTGAAAKVGRGVLKGANVTGQVLTYIPPTSAVGKGITVGTNAVSAADRVNQRLKHSKGSSWAQGSSGLRAGPSVVNPRNRNLPSGRPRQMDSMDKELQKMITEAAKTKKTIPPVKPTAGKGTSMTSV